MQEGGATSHIDSIALLNNKYKQLTSVFHLQQVQKKNLSLIANMRIRTYTIFHCKVWITTPAHSVKSVRRNHRKLPCNSGLVRVKKAGQNTRDLFQFANKFLNTLRLLTLTRGRPIFIIQDESRSK